MHIYKDESHLQLKIYFDYLKVTVPSKKYFGQTYAKIQEISRIHDPHDEKSKILAGIFRGILWILYYIHKGRMLRGWVSRVPGTGRIQLDAGLLSSRPQPSGSLKQLEARSRFAVHRGANSVS